MRSPVIFSKAYNAAGLIMDAILDIFKVVVTQCLVIYINAIIINFRTYEERVTDIQEALQQVEEQKYYLKESKF